MSVHNASGSFGTYRLERLLGRGGMGEVWLARDRTGAAVALKVLSAAYSADPGYRLRFEREAQAGARVRNPHIVPIRSFGEVDGHLFLEMAYIEGVDLATRLRSGALAPVRAVEVIAQAAEALDAAHAAGLVHRDVKPGNILEHTSGFVYLIDFGIARAVDATALTATGQVVGTLGYMAPERFTGTAEARSDVYSLACVLYEVLTGSLPFGDGDPARQMRAHLMSPPPRASVTARGGPPALDAVIARGMAKQPLERYASAGEFAAAARAALEQPVSAESASTGPDTAQLGSHPPTRVMTAPRSAATRPTPRSPEPRTFSPASTANPDSPRKPPVRRSLPIAAGAVLVAAAALWLGGDLGSDSAPGTVTRETSAEARTDDLPPATGGQPSGPAGAVQDGDFAFTVPGVVSESAAGGSYTVVTLTVTNVSQRQQAFVIADQRLITTAGRSLAPDATATTELNASRNSVDRIDPGSTRTIRLAFYLPGHDKDGKKNDKKNDKKDDVPRELVLYGAPSSPGVSLPVR
ncbi:protein kinase [Streptomyces gardneri]|uniref:serine/threonine-protein kinase n=1 Tax=Nocardia TaxID=1817 RepID=UPI001357CDBB|nr:MULTISPECIES: serine/threonine-protein kinase [Nocardia]MBF6168045.1 protein kinase [Streptomyces gardneri]MBF6206824.1 protein kinase [Streptomyces gardneri]